MSMPFRPCPKPSAAKHKPVRVKPTQRQMGEISKPVDRELKHRSHGVCEWCGRCPAAERAHLTGRGHLEHKTTAADLAHVCTECHRELDGTETGIRARRLIATIVNAELQRERGG